MNFPPRKQASNHLDLENDSSRSSSYYELDINYSPHKEKLLLQLQSVNKSLQNQDDNQDAVHHVPPSSSKPVTEDIKDKFLEEIVPIYMNYIARKKKKTTRKDPRMPANVCGFDVKLSCDQGKVEEVVKTVERRARTAPPALKPKKECLHSGTVDSVEKGVKLNALKQLTQPPVPSSSHDVYSCPTTTEETIAPAPKQKPNKSTTHKEKGKLTTRKVPRAPRPVIETTSCNNSGDATTRGSSRLGVSSVTTQETGTSPAPTKRNTQERKSRERKGKPEMVCASTQVKPKELRARGLKVMQNDSETTETVQQVNNKEVYFVLVSQNGFDSTRPVKIPIDSNDLQKKLGIDNEKLDETLRYGTDKKHHQGTSNKEIQTRKQDTDASIQATLVTHKTKPRSQKQCKPTITQVCIADSDSRDNDDVDLQRRKIRFKRRKDVVPVPYTSSTDVTYVIPVKEKGQKLPTVDTCVTTKPMDYYKMRRSCIVNSEIISNKIHMRPPLLETPLDLKRKSVYQKIRKLERSEIEGIHTGTNTENQFFLARHICLFGDKKPNAPVRLKDRQHPATTQEKDDSVLRTELSFDDLNLSPVLSYYFNHPNKYNRNASALVHTPHSIREQYNMIRHYASSRTTASKIQHRPRNASFTQSTIETSKKTYDDVSKTGGFEVEGIEPPRKIGFDRPDKPHIGNSLCTSHFPVIEIPPDVQVTRDDVLSDTFNVKVGTITQNVSGDVESKLQCTTVGALTCIEDTNNKEEKIEEEVEEEEIVETVDRSVPNIAETLTGNDAIVTPSSRKAKSYCSRAVLCTRWRSRIIQVSRKRRVNKRLSCVQTSSHSNAVPASVGCSPEITKSSDNVLGRITEESHSHVSTDAGKKEKRKTSPRTTEIVKSMKKADVKLALQIDRIFKLRNPENNQKNKDSPPHPPTKIAKRTENEERESEKGTKVCLSDIDEKKSARTNCTSLLSKPSCSSNDSGNVVSGKRKRKKKFRPMIPVKSWKSRNAQNGKWDESAASENDWHPPKQKPQSAAQQKTEKSLSHLEGETSSLVKVRSSNTTKCYWGKSQKRSDSTFTARMGPSLKSTQLFVSCKPRSAASSRKPLASTCLFTKDYRNSKTKLSAFQKRKLYGEYLRKAKTQNHSVHSICEIIVCDKEENKSKPARPKKKIKQLFPKECNQEMKLMVTENDNHGFTFENFDYSSRSTIHSSNTIIRPPSPPVPPSPPPPQAAQTPPSQKNRKTENKGTTPAVRRITTVSLNRAKMKLQNRVSRRNCFVLMEMFNNKRFETDSSTSMSNRGSFLENYFFNCACAEHAELNKETVNNYKSSHSERVNNTTVPAASQILEEINEIAGNSVHSKETNDLLKNIDIRSALNKTKPTKSCDSSLSRTKRNKSVSLAQWKLTKSFSDCDLSKRKSKCIGRICFPLPDTSANNKSPVNAAEKYSSDSLEKPSEHSEKKEGSFVEVKQIVQPLYLQDPDINASVVPKKQKVTIVAYNTEMKYDKDSKTNKTDSAEVASAVEESGYESNKSKNTIKRFLKRKFNFFKSSKLEIATKDPSGLVEMLMPRSNAIQDTAGQLNAKTEELLQTGNEKQDRMHPDAASSTDNEHFCDLSVDRISLSRKCSTKKSSNESPWSAVIAPKEKNEEAIVNPLPVIKTNMNDHLGNKTTTWANLCNSAGSRGVVQFCYISKVSGDPLTSRNHSGGTPYVTLEYEEDTLEDTGDTPFDLGKTLLDKKRDEKHLKKKLQGIKKKFSTAPRKVNVKVSAEIRDDDVYVKEKTIATTNSSPVAENDTAIPELKLENNKEIISYLESRFKELEEKIERVGNNGTKYLRDIACMCSKHTIDKVMQANTRDAERGTCCAKCPNLEIGVETDSNRMKSREVNTDSFFPKRQNRKAKRYDKGVNTKQPRTVKVLHKEIATENNTKGTNTPRRFSEKMIQVSAKYPGSYKMTAIEKKITVKCPTTGDLACTGVECSCSVSTDAIKTAPNDASNKTGHDNASTSHTEPDVRVKCSCPTGLAKHIKNFQEYAQKVRTEAELRKDGHLKQLQDFEELPLSVLLGKSEQTAKAQPAKAQPPKAQPAMSDSKHRKVSVEPPERKGKIKFSEAPLLKVISSTSLDGSSSEDLHSHTQKGKHDKDHENDEEDDEDDLDEKMPRESTFNVLARAKDSVMLKHKRILGIPGTDYFVRKRQPVVLPKDKHARHMESKRTHDEPVEDSPPNEEKEPTDGGKHHSDNTDDEVKTENPNEKHRAQFTDQELFDKLLESYERENDIAEKLSKDDEFFHAQLSTVRSKESVEKLLALGNEGKAKKKKLSHIFRRKGSFTEIVPVRRDEDGDSEDQLDVISKSEHRVAQLLYEKSQLKIQQMEDEEEQKNRKDDAPLEKERELTFSDDLSDETMQTVQTVQTVQIVQADSPFEKPQGTNIEPKEIGKCFKRGFRPDNIVLTGEPCLKISEKDQHSRVSSEAATAYIDFSERDTPLEFLLGLGFSVDEASNAIKDEDVKNRLNAAITEARVWINRISATQGTMLYLVAFKTRPRTMRYFLQLVEAIINQRIVDAVRLDGFLKLLEKIEEGNVNMITVLGMDKIDDEQNEENVVKKQLRKLFYDVYKIAESEARAQQKQLSKAAIILLRILAAKYRAGLQPHLELIAKYIGQGLLTNEVQLEAAMIYLARVDTADVNLRDFEEYCAITCKERVNDKRKKS